MPIPTQVYQDPVLTDISVKYTNTDLVADRVFPVVPVKKKTGVYFTYDKTNLRVANTERAGVTRANRADYTLTKTNYGPLVEHSLETPIEDDVMEMYDDPLDPRTDATELVTEMILLEKESKLATTLADTTQVTQNVTLSGTSQWSDYANSNPFTDIQTGITTMIQNGMKSPNTLLIPQVTWNQLVNHPDFIDRIKYSQLGVFLPEMMQKLFPSITNVIVAPAVSNTATSGQTDSLSYIWGKHFWLMYVTPTPGIRTISAGYTLSLYGGRQIDGWDDRSVKAEFVRCTDYYQQKIVATEAIYLIKNAVA